MEFNDIPSGGLLDQEPYPIRHPFTESLQILEEDHHSDIFRGEPPRPSSPLSISPSSSSSSSSSRSGGRFTAIAAVVEQAISRWARHNDGDDSSDSSSSRSSVVTLSRPRKSARRLGRPSITSLRNQQSERDLAAKFRARQESRHIPREFVLYLPPAGNSRAPNKKYSASEQGKVSPSQRVSRTSSLSLILGQLENTLKRSKKDRRSHSRGRAMSTERTANTPGPLIQKSTPPQQHLDYMSPVPILEPCSPASCTELAALPSKKGKEREGTLRSGMSTPNIDVPTFHKPKIDVTNVRSPKAWWLDISSPTWEDMRAIGKLLHLHPLTLEDILQQDPREKLELFPRLGYYFVSFRAIESQATRERFRRFRAMDGDHDEFVDDRGAVGEVNVYLVVFREGVCSFHFEDIAEHTDRVRNRLTLLEDNLNMSSDWIAHGILDSVVDSFFPFLEEMEKEVLGVEDIVFSVDQRTTEPAEPQELTQNVPEKPMAVEDSTALEKLSVVMDEKSTTRGSVKTRFSFPRPTFTLILRRLKRAIQSLSLSISVTVTTTIYKTPNNPRATDLRRMARTRRLVTSLTRLLATKSEVVAQIRKRLLTAGRSGLGNGAGKDDDIEVAIYMGDVQDHILTLQHVLAHYERMLSQSHPNYLSQLGVSVATTKSSQDKSVMLLTIVSLAVICNQAMIGFFSMNVRIPKNGHGVYNLFGVVIALVLLITGLFLWQVDVWWKQAKRRRGAIF